MLCGKLGRLVFDKEHITGQHMGVRQHDGMKGVQNSRAVSKPMYHDNVFTEPFSGDERKFVAMPEQTTIR